MLASAKPHHLPSCPRWSSCSSDLESMAFLPTMTVLLVAMVAMLVMEPHMTVATPSLERFNRTRSSGNGSMRNGSGNGNPTKHVHRGGINKGRLYNRGHNKSTIDTHPHISYRGAKGGQLNRKHSGKNTQPGLVHDRKPANNKPYFGVRRSRGGHESNRRDGDRNGGRVSAGRDRRGIINHGGLFNRTRAGKGAHQYIPKGGRDGQAHSGNNKGGSNAGNNSHGNDNQGSNNQGNNNHGSNNQGSNSHGDNNQGSNSGQVGQGDSRSSAGNTTGPDCKKEGGVCGDPKVVGGDGRVFYFYGRRDRDFCLVSDPNLHINAHFIGTRPPHRTRDNTWVQSLAFFHAHSTLTVAAVRNLSHWSPEENHLQFTYNHLPLNLTTSWTSPDSTMTLTGSPNSVEITIPGKMEVAITVVPVSREANLVHKYEVPEDVDCFAHLDMQFTFWNLSPEVDGVLGQTYRHANRSVVESAFESSSLLATDCASSRFTGGVDSATTASKFHSVCRSSGVSGHGFSCNQ